MKIEDLRIGNWIHYCNVGYKQVDLFDLKCILEGEDREYIYAPIKINEDIFLKCGFVIDKIHNCIIIYQKESGPEIIYDLDENALFFVGKTSAEDLTHIKYLHQLQNLIHALTGEELTVNL